MKIVLGGYLETALVHYCDEIKQPDRNTTSHSYYVCLNRRVHKSYFDRAGTFISLAETTIVPSIDWSGGSSGGPIDPDVLGLEVNGEERFGGQEWDDETQAFAKWLIEQKAFSRKSWVHLSDLDIKHRNMGKKITRRESVELERQVAEHYLCRLFLHVRASSDANSMLVLAEPDLELLAEIGEFAAKRKIPLPFAFPDLRNRTIAADDFAAGLLNYSPKDALSLMAVRQDKDVKEYAKKLQPLLSDAGTFEGQRKIISAMRDAYEVDTAAQKAEKVFEVVSWVVKPLHYVPVVAEVLTFAEDAKDLANVFVKKTAEAKEWYLVGVKMTDISVKDYMARKGNFF